MVTITLCKHVGGSIMATYIKKPIKVTAYQTSVTMKIETLEGTMTASPGDYIITGIDGEQYPCKKEIFERTYEEIADDK